MSASPRFPVPLESHSMLLPSPTEVQQLIRARMILAEITEFFTPPIPVTHQMRTALRRVLTDVRTVMDGALACATECPDDSEDLLCMPMPDLITCAYDYPLDGDFPSDCEEHSSPVRKWVITAGRRLVCLHVPTSGPTSLKRAEWWLDSQSLTVRRDVVEAAVNACP